MKSSQPRNKSSVVSQNSEIRKSEWKHFPTSKHSFFTDDRFSFPAVQETTAGARTLRPEPRGRTNFDSFPVVFVIAAPVRFHQTSGRLR